MFVLSVLLAVSRDFIYLFILFLNYYSLLSLLETLKARFVVEVTARTQRTLDLWISATFKKKKKSYAGLTVPPKREAPITKVCKN